MTDVLTTRYQKRSSHAVHRNTDAHGGTTGGLSCTGVCRIQVRQQRLLGMSGYILHSYNLPSCGNMQDGTALRFWRSSGSNAACTRDQKPKSDRLLHHTENTKRKHERSHHNDWGEGFRHDQGCLATQEWTELAAFVKRSVEQEMSRENLMYG